MPPPKGLKGGKGKDLPAPVKKPRPPVRRGHPGQGWDKPAATPASETAPAAETAAPPKKKNKLLRRLFGHHPDRRRGHPERQGQGARPHPRAHPGRRPLRAAPSAAPAQPRQDPLRPWKAAAETAPDGGRRRRGERALGGKTGRTEEGFGGGAQELGDRRRERGLGGMDRPGRGSSPGTTARSNRAEAASGWKRPPPGGPPRPSCFWVALRNPMAAAEKAVDYYVQGAASIASGKSEARDAKLEGFATRLDRLEAAAEAAKIRARASLASP